MGRHICLLAVLLYSVFVRAQTISGNTIICQGKSTTLSVTGATGTYKWERSTDNGATWTQVGTSATYAATQAGSYRVTVNGNQVSNVVDVVVNPLPKPSFTFAPNSACAGTPVAFTNTSTGAATYLWNFNDPNAGTYTSTAQNATHSFTGATGSGTQNITVSLTATSSDGCTDVSSQTVTIKRRPGTELNGTGTNQYKGETFFTQCTGAPSGNITVTNGSSTKNQNTDYKISWGDAGANFQSNQFNQAQSHNYTTGTYSLNFIVTGSNGCVDTGKYKVFIGSNPAVGLGNPGNTNICTGSALTFPINTVAANPPGTEYTVTFNDGSASLNFLHPPPNDVTHTFNKSSCGTTSDGYSNAFLATITAANPCQSSKATVVPIYVSQKPTANFSISPRDTVCIGSTVNVTNTSLSNYVTNQGCVQGKSVWTITPSPGWNSNSNLGSDNGATDPNLWTAGANTISLSFTTPGTYVIKLKTGNPICGLDSITRVICVNPKPAGSFDLDKLTGCAPLTVTGSSNINSGNCGNNSVMWNINYSALSGCTPATRGDTYINGTNSTSASPVMQLANPGTYNISVTLSAPGGACPVTLSAKPVTVKGKPSVSSNVPSLACQNAPVNFSSSATCTPGNGFTYAWTFPTGSPASSTQQNQAGVLFSATGTQNVTLNVTNECGTTTVTKPININEIPKVSAPGNLQFCPGETTGVISLSSFTPGASVTWSRTSGSIGLSATSGSGNIPSFTASNGSASPITSTFTVRATIGGCTTSTSFSITVNPRPATPASVTPVYYCQGAAAVALTATPTADHSLLWYSSGTGPGSTTAPIPSTTAAGKTTYYVSQVSGTTSCESPKKIIDVFVTPRPVITANAVTPTSCTTPNGSITISGLVTGSSYLIQYTKDGVVATPVTKTASGGTISLSGLGSGVYNDITVTLNGCTSSPVGPFSFTDPNPPPAPVISANNSPVCSGGTLSLSATGAGTGVTYSWSGPNNFTSTSANPTIQNVTVAASGTYSVKTLLSGCSSGAVTTTVSILPRPAQPTINSNSPICSGATLSLTATTAGTTSVSYAWAGPDGFTSNLQNPVILNATPAAAGTYSVVATSGACSSPAKTAIVQVTGTVAISGSASTDPTTCGSPTGTITLSGLTAGSAYQVTYKRNGVAASATVNASSSGAVVVSGLTAGVYTDITVSQNGCTSAAVGPLTLTDPNPPATPVASAATLLCSGNTLSLTASTTTSGTATYAWTGPNNFSSNQQNPNIPNVTSAATGTYLVTVKINGCTSASGSVNITVNPTPVVSRVASNSPQCAGGTLSLTAEITGPGNYNYNWSGPNGFTSSDQNPIIVGVGPSASGTYSLTVTDANCASLPQSTVVQIAGATNISSASAINPTACASTTGSIRLNGLSANQVYTYSYSLNGIQQSGTGTADANGILVIGNLAAGTYADIGVTAAGCRSNLVGPFILTETNAPAAPIATSSGLICTGQTLQLSATAGSSIGVTYRWTGPNGFSSDQQNPSILNAGVDASGVYQVVVTSQGCASSPGTVSVTVAAAPNLSVSQSMNLCRGQSAQLNVQGAASYQWSPMNGLSCSTCPDPIVNASTTTTYVVEGRTAIGCKSYDTVVVRVIQPFSISAMPADTICVGEAVNLLASGAPNYQWMPSHGLSDPTVSNPVAAPTATTEYMVVGYDDYNCFTDTGKVMIVVGEIPVVDLGPDLSVTTGTKIQLNPEVKNGPVDVWNWSPSTNLSCTNCPTPGVTITKDISYNLRVTNVFGCSAEDNIAIKVSCDASQVFIPNAFTPNGDGVNDILVVRAAGVSIVKFFRVFNRWGELVFEKSNFTPNDPASGWDGKSRGVTAPPDVFVYTVEVICDNGANYSYKGNVSILK